MADVFISYAREDRARAEQVATALSAMGLDCFWDTDIPPGQTWADYTEGKLAQCKVVVVLWTAHSTKSQWVREEARMGRDRNRLIPAILDGSAPPLGFGEVQAANLASWRGEATHPDWLRFAGAVERAVRGPGAAPRPAAQAPPQPAFASPAAGATVSPIEYIRKCFALYADGKGRARRSEYGWFVLFQVVAAIFALGIDSAVFGFNSYTSAPNSYLVSWLLLGVIAPSLSAASRRAHDIGQTGWIAAATILPYVGWLAALALIFIPGQAGANKYGPNPKGV